MQNKNYFYQKLALERGDLFVIYGQNILNLGLKDLFPSRLSAENRQAYLDCIVETLADIDPELKLFTDDVRSLRILHAHKYFSGNFFTPNAIKDLVALNCARVQAVLDKDIMQLGKEDIALIGHRVSPTNIYSVLLDIVAVQTVLHAKNLGQIPEAKIHLPLNMDGLSTVATEIFQQAVECVRANPHALVGLEAFVIDHKPK